MGTGDYAYAKAMRTQSLRHWPSRALGVSLDPRATPLGAYSI